MKKLYTVAFFIILAFSFFSCQQELHFPEPEPVSLFTVVADGVTYNLEIQEKIMYTGDTAHVQVLATSPQISVRLVSKSDQHTNGVGNYFLWCCNNDIFDRTTGTQMHWEMNRTGAGGPNRQKGSVTITKWDEEVLEGTYAMTGKVGTDNNAPVKEFTGSFTIYF